MNKFIQPLRKCILFKDLSDDEIDGLLSKIKFTLYEKCMNCINCKTCILALEGEDCTSIGIVLQGNVEIQKHYPNGKIVSLSSLNEGKIFGEAIVFSSHHKYPATIVTMRNSKIMHISREDIIYMCSVNSQVLKNFMELLSSKILNLNKKVTELSLETLRQKIIFYLLQLYKEQKTLKLMLPISKKSLAEYLGVQRPSLSRELINMKNEGLINVEKDLVEILDIETLQDYINIY
ncbi:Crp/Fnr family transcriptional regulator [Clostridium tunisiense]|uniref:Crp/Fnr family transcriptional regulator n=1 Tax=Clostridium tunisiense TaxID=219748 RepID=UPI000318312F|nr:Crp/Fnr family transcriptional regulator [Clostridium tunisiense]